MCGIVGIAGRVLRKDEEMLRRMRDSMTHRGPDDAGEWWSEDGAVGLGMRRLAIIDLSPSGHQPMSNHENNLVIVFNGEVYNYKELRTRLESMGHRFRTASDTEVILEAYLEWKHDCVTHLNGMFAFAVYDRKAKQIFFARDRSGEKPLFYLHENGVLWFGSELKSILASEKVPPVLDREALEFYLSFGYVPGDLCLLKGFRKLPPGHAMTYDVESDRLEVHSYWNLPDPVQNSGEDVEELSARLTVLLEDAVRRQLVADVPVGIMLSGGIDSSLVTAMASRSSGRNLKTFTVTFPGFGTYNEAPYARMVARHFGTDHTELEAESVRPEIMFELARQYDEPIADSSMIPTYMLSKLIRRHATVALGGDGGDELFGGYLHYSMILKSARRQNYLPATFRKLVHPLVHGFVPTGFPYRNKALAFLSPSPHDTFRTDPYFETPMIGRILQGNGRALLSDADKMKFNSFAFANSFTALQRATRVDFLNYLPHDVLVKVDRASMLASLEVRAPFLDHRIVEFAFRSVPDRLKATEGARKILLKSVASKLLPPELDLNRKQGFSVPLGNWFQKGWGEFMKGVLLDQSQTLFDKDSVRRLASLQERGIFNYQRLYALTMLELWRREYGVALP